MEILFLLELLFLLEVFVATFVLQVKFLGLQLFLDNLLGQAVCNLWYYKLAWDFVSLDLILFEFKK